MDTNALIILLLGSIDTKLINTNKRTSIYEEQDYYDLLNIIGNIDKLVVLPNVWTETDNLLNKSSYWKYKYIEILKETVKETTEIFIESYKGLESHFFYELGLTDSLLLEYSNNCELLITSDSALSDHAKAKGIKVFDVVENRNLRIEVNKLF